MKTYLVIDVGGTAIKYARMDEDANFLSKGEIKTPRESLDVFVETIANLYTENKDVSGIAMSAPGRIDADTGYIYTGGALEYNRDVPLRDLIKAKVSVEVSIDNDAKCAANAEVWKGSLQNVKCGMVLTIGTGIGGAVVIDGKVHRGHNFTSGEVSFLPTTLLPEGHPLRIWAMINSTGNLVENYAKAKNLELNEVNGKIFFDAIQANDTIANKILGDFSESFAIGLFTIQTILDTETIAIGGGISAQKALIDSLNQKTDELFEQFNWAPQKRMNIIPCFFGNDSNLIGALYHHLNLYKKH